MLPTRPLCEFRLRLEPYPAKPSHPPKRTAPLVGSGSLQRSRFRRSTLRGRSLPATFRPRGLVTPSTAYSLRSPAGFISHRRRSWDSPFGAFSSREVSGRFRPQAPTYRSSQRSFPPRKRLAGPLGRGSWALALARVPCGRRVFSTPPAGCSLGVRPSRVYRRKPHPGFRPDSSHVLGRLCTRRAESACTSESHYAPAWPHPSLHVETQVRDKATLLGFPRRHAPDRSSAATSGLWVHLAPRRTLLPTSRRSEEATCTLPEPPGTA